MESRGETEITAPLYDSLKKLDSEKKGISVKTSVEVRADFIKHAIVPLSVPEIEANLSAEFAREAGGPQPKVSPELLKKTITDLTCVIAATRQAIITEFEQLENQPEQDSETRARLDRLRQQLEAKFVPQVDLLNARVEAAQDAYRAGDVKTLESMASAPLVPLDLRQASFRGLETQARNVTDRLPPLKTLDTLDRRALQLIRTESLQAVMQDPKRAADQKILTDFAESFLGKVGKSGVYETAMAEARALPTAPRDRMLWYGQLRSLAQVANELKGSAKIDPYALEQRMILAEVADPTIAKIALAEQDYLRWVVGAQKFELPALARGNVDFMKIEIYQQRTDDPRLNLLGKIVHQKGQTTNIDEAKAAFQLIRDLQAEGRQLRFSPENMEKQALKWQKRGVSEKELKKQEHTKLLWQMAAYELSFVAEDLMRTGDPKVQKNISDLEKIEGHGYQTTATVAKDYNYQNAGNTAGKILSPTGFASGFLMYTGLMTTILNLAYSIQNDDYDNPYIFLGAGTAYLGAKGISTNYLDTLMHPENREFNELAAIVHTPLNPVITEILANKEEQAFLRHLDLGKTGNLQFKSLLRQESQQENMVIKAARQGEPTEKAPYAQRKNLLGMGTPKLEVSKAELKPGEKQLADAKGEFDWSTLVLPGHEADAQAALARMRTNPDRDHWRFQAISWLYNRNITNDRLDKTFVHAEGITKAQFNRPPVKVNHFS